MQTPEAIQFLFPAQPGKDGFYHGLALSERTLCARLLHDLPERIARLVLRVAFDARDFALVQRARIGQA